MQQISAHALTQLLFDLVAAPTAPFREEWVAARIDAALDRIAGVETAVDRFGNRIARLRRGNPAGPPLTFVAHMDHPGFIFDRDRGAGLNGDRRIEAIFEGIVRDAYFHGAPVRLFRGPEDDGVAGRVVEAGPYDRSVHRRRVVIEVEEPAAGAYLAMWDLPTFSVEDGTVEARVCDDLVGCAAIVQALEALADLPEVDVAAVFSRAEEAGFCGVLCMLGESGLPEPLDPATTFVSVEASGEIPGIEIGGGPVIRAGDKATTFDAQLVDRCQKLARAHGIAARRAVMGRGTCEATVFARAGYPTGGLCVPLRNYHNMDPDSRRLVPEQIAISDMAALSRLIALMAAPEAQAHAAPDLAAEFETYRRKGLRELTGAHSMPNRS